MTAEVCSTVCVGCLCASGIQCRHDVLDSGMWVGGWVNVGGDLTAENKLVMLCCVTLCPNLVLGMPLTNLMVSLLLSSGGQGYLRESPHRRREWH